MKTSWRCERCAHYIPVYMPYIKKWSYQCELDSSGKHLSYGCGEEYKRKTDEEYNEMLRNLGREK